MLYAHICVYFYMYFLKSTRPSIWYMFYASSFPCFLELVTFPYQVPPHPKVDVSGDMNMQGSLDDNCAASQNGRGGMFFVLEEPWMGLLSTGEQEKWFSAMRFRYPGDSMVEQDPNDISKLTWILAISDPWIVYMYHWHFYIRPFWARQSQVDPGWCVAWWLEEVADGWHCALRWWRWPTISSISSIPTNATNTTNTSISSFPANAPTISSVPAIAAIRKMCGSWSCVMNEVGNGGLGGEKCWWSGWCCITRLLCYILVLFVAS